VDEVLIFHRLDEGHMEAIVRIQLDRLNQLLAQQRLRVEATDAAVALLAHAGFDPDFGARPLKRVIQRLVSDQLANMVLEGRIGEGEIVTLDATGGELVLRPASPAMAAEADEPVVDAEVVD
jgi:ATP-dependent Clp protease ATP-binding subunit ClpA